ncbi:aminotransferase class IV [Planctomycetota bacterium]
MTRTKTVHETNMHTIAYLNGQFVKSGDLNVPPYDAGFLLGATIAEQIRTFHGRPFWLKQHLNRLHRGLALAGIELPIGGAALHDAVRTVIGNNHPIQSRDEADDIGITIFVTPGPYEAYGVNSDGPTVAVHTYPLQFRIWADKYQSGQRAVISAIREVPADCWPAAIKCRSRMHYFLASKAARETDCGAIPILLDHDGYVSETPIASVLTYTERNGFAVPSPEKTLPGISLAYVKQWAARRQIPFRHLDLQPADLANADEVILVSTPFCALPLVVVDGKPIRDGTPGGIYSQLVNDWSDDVGVDISKQAEVFRTLGEPAVGPAT